MQPENNTRNLVLAIALSAVVLGLWTIFNPAPKNVEQPLQETAQPAQVASAAKEAVAESTPVVSPADFVADGGRQITVDTPLYTAVLNSNGGVLEKFTLKKYRQTVDLDSAGMELIVPEATAKAPMGLMVNGRATWKGDPWRVEGESMTLDATGKGTLKFYGQVEGMNLVRELTFDASTYLVNETVRMLDANPKLAAATTIGFTMDATGFSETSSRINQNRIGYKNESETSNESDEEDLAAGVTVADSIKWAGVQNNYFFAGVAPVGPDFVLKGRKAGDVMTVVLEHQGMVSPEGDLEVSTHYYLGPLEISAMEGVPNDLDQAIDYGWFGVVSKPLMIGLRYLFDLTGNWGIAIILLTVVVKGVLWPVSHKGYKGMQQQKKLQPMMAKIREKYADDRQRQQQEIMKLYKTYKISPVSGCLPMFLQIPFFLGLYQGLMGSVDLRHAAFITHVPFTDYIWLNDLSAPDPYYITPVLMGVLTLAQQMLTPMPGADPMQKKMMYIMPLVLLWFALTFPSGLVLYWITNTLLSAAQMFMIMGAGNKSKQA